MCMVHTTQYAFTWGVLCTCMHVHGKNKLLKQFGIDETLPSWKFPVIQPLCMYTPCRRKYCTYMYIHVWQTGVHTHYSGASLAMAIASIHPLPNGTCVLAAPYTTALSCRFYWWPMPGTLPTELYDRCSKKVSQTEHPFIPGSENSLIRSELAHEPIVGVSTAANGLHMLLGLCQGHLILLHHVCYHLDIEKEWDHLTSLLDWHALHYMVHIHVHVNVHCMCTQYMCIYTCTCVHVHACTVVCTWSAQVTYSGSRSADPHLTVH